MVERIEVVIEGTEVSVHTDISRHPGEKVELLMGIFLFYRSSAPECSVHPKSPLVNIVNG